MFSKVKKFSGAISAVMALALTVAMVGTTVVSAEETQTDEFTDNECTQIITNHFNCINSNDWSSWANYYVPAVRDSYLSFVQNENCQENNVGILTVNNVDVLSVYSVPNSYAPNYPELAEFYANNDYECFVATMDITTNEETEYFKNGITNRLVVMVKEGGEWGIGASCEYQAPMTRGTGYGFLEGDVNNPPSTIKVDMHVGSDYSKINVAGKPTNVDFKTFVKKTVLGEIGTAGYEAEAIKAVTLSDKMFSWWCVLGSYRDTYGCDIIGNFDVAYNSSTSLTDSKYKTTLTSVNAVIDYYVVSSEGKFFAIGANNYSSYDKESSGVVVQSGANSLAKNSGYTYTKILHYYLDNSSHNNGDVGVVKIAKSK